MSILNGILIVIVLWIMPYLSGSGFCKLMREKCSLAKSYIMGWVVIWSFCQLITVPLVLLKASFLLVFVLMLLGIGSLCIYSIITKSYREGLGEGRINFQRSNHKSVIIVSGLFMVLFIGIAFATQHIDADDSRFVVNAVDIIRTNRMFLTDPTTGLPLECWTGELCKDVTAPWAVFIAYCAKASGVSATIMAHTFLPIALITAIFCVWWLLSEVFFDKDVVHRCIFMDTLLFLHIYGYYSVYSEETFMMTRLWQGKAVVAALGIPLCLLICMWLYEESCKKYYIMLAMSNVALCLMSGMGVIIGGLILGVFGGLYGIWTRKILTAINYWIILLPNVLYCFIYYKIKV